MQRVLALLLCALTARADWDASRTRFLERFTKEAPPAQRLQAITELAGSDCGPAAEMLVNVWQHLQEEVVRLRRDLRVLRDRIPEISAEDPRLREARQEEGRVNTLLAQREREQGAVVDGIASLKSDQAVAWLADEAIERVGEPALLLPLALKVAAARATGVHTLLVTIDRTREPERLVPLLRALADRGPLVGPGLPSILKQILHKDAAVRAAAARAAAATAQPEAVDALVAAIQKEKTDSRCLVEMARALEEVTGQAIGPFPDLWRNWWAGNREAVLARQIPLGKAKAGAREGRSGTYYGIPQDSSRIIYVLDISGSMQVSMEKPEWVDDQPVPAADGHSRFEAAVRELIRAVKSLRRGTRFAVILFSSEARALHTDLVPVDGKTVGELEGALANEFADGSTNMYAALDRAIRLAGVHPESQTRSEVKADEIFFVSDGSPTDSTGKREDPRRVLDAVRDWNALNRVTIHAIGIGAEHNADFLKRLARENGGQYYAVAPKPK